MQTISFGKRIKALILLMGITGIMNSFCLKAQDLSNLENKKPVTLSGSLGVNFSFYNVNGIKARQDPFTYGLMGSATLSAYGISMPFLFTWYNHKSNFTQPFNQFGISPSYKWI